MNKNSLNPIVLIVIGVIVGVSSIFINISSDSNFSLFIISGFVMAGYGLIKFVFSKRVDKSDAEPRKVHDIVGTKHNNKIHQHTSQHNRHHNQHNHVQHGQHHQNMHNPAGQGGNNSSFSFCPGCGGRLPGNVNFCPHCGARLH